MKRFLHRQPVFAAGLAVLISLFLLQGTEAKAQQKYWVYLKDKKGVSFDPYTYFHPKALERRVRQQLPLNHVSDWPLNQTYVATIAGKVDSVTFASRWLNAVVCYGSAAQLDKISKLPFVRSVEISETESDFKIAAADDFDTDLNQKEEEMLAAQLETMASGAFINNGIDGKGLRVAIFDAGFSSVDKNPAFEHIRSNKRIIKTWDFVKNKEFVYDHSSHGTMVLSCVGGSMAGRMIGLATGAEFLLARTEWSKREPYKEEENWLAAMEWADKNGADIINSSLGYTNKRYFRNQMDGKHSLVAKAANMAAKKGILVVNSAGNEGSDSWKIIGTPADADSVLSIGGINPNGLYHTSFSSYGPTSDKRLKPNVTAFGHVIASGPSGFEETQGTSFSGPLVAGFAACAWQTNRNLKNMELFKEIEKSGNLYPYFDYAHGYGIPQATYFTGNTEPVVPTFDFVKTESALKVVIKPEFFTPDSAMTFDTTAMDLDTNTIDTMSVIDPVRVDDKKDDKKDDKEKDKGIPTVNFDLNPGVMMDDKDPEYLYYHIENDKGYLDKYYVIAVSQNEVLNLNLADIGRGKTIRVHYKNYTGTYKLD